MFKHCCRLLTYLTITQIYMEFRAPLLLNVDFLVEGALSVYGVEIEVTSHFENQHNQSNQPR